MVMPIAGSVRDTFSWTFFSLHFCSRNQPADLKLVNGPDLTLASPKPMWMSSHRPFQNLTIFRSIVRTIRPDFPGFSHLSTIYAVTHPHSGIVLPQFYHSASSLMDDPTTADGASRLVQHDGQAYQAVKEGRAYILNPPTQLQLPRGQKRTSNLKTSCNLSSTIQSSNSTGISVCWRSRPMVSMCWPSRS